MPEGGGAVAGGARPGAAVEALCQSQQLSAQTLQRALDLRSQVRACCGLTIRMCVNACVYVCASVYVCVCAHVCGVYVCVCSHVIVHVYVYVSVSVL